MQNINPQPYLDILKKILKVVSVVGGIFLIIGALFVLTNPCGLVIVSGLTIAAAVVTSIYGFQFLCICCPKLYNLILNHFTSSNHRNISDKTPSIENLNTKLNFNNCGEVKFHHNHTGKRFKLTFFDAVCVTFTCSDGANKLFESNFTILDKINKLDKLCVNSVQGNTVHVNAGEFIDFINVVFLKLYINYFADKGFKENFNKLKSQINSIISLVFYPSDEINGLWDIDHLKIEYSKYLQCKRG